MDSEPLKQLLLRGWMTHDAMWFKNTLDRFGIETANELNRAAIRDMAPIEVSRLLRVLKLERVSSFQELEAFMTGAMDLLAGDYFDFHWQWVPPNRLCVEVEDCFAFKGISRLGAIEHYECGLFDRIHRWFDVLKVKYESRPAVEHCMKHHDGSCVRELRFFCSG